MDIQKSNTSVRELCLAVLLGGVTAIVFGGAALLAVAQLYATRHPAVFITIGAIIGGVAGWTFAVWIAPA